MHMAYAESDQSQQMAVNDVSSSNMLCETNDSYSDVDSGLLKIIERKNLEISELQKLIQIKNTQIEHLKEENQNLRKKLATAKDEERISDLALINMSMTTTQLNFILAYQIINLLWHFITLSSQKMGIS